MKVIINEKQYDYTPDFPGDAWVFSRGDYFKKVLIGSHICFVKRFEISRPENISGWKLMMNLKGKNKENLVRLYDIVGTTEKNRNVCYVFYEFIEGETLHKLILNNEAIDLEQITKDLFNAIRLLYESGYWFADFTEKNIFYSRGGKYVLIDIDSAQPLELAPDNDMWGDKVYWIPVLNFYKNILHDNNFGLADINGMSLNYLQLIFLILRIKLFDSNKAIDYFSSDLLTSLPATLDKQSSFFKQVFHKVRQRAGFPLQNDEITEIKNLIEDKIINAAASEIVPPYGNWNALVSPEDERSNPIIEEFNVIYFAEKQGDHYLVESGKSFTLNWKVKNTLNVELFKNNEFYKRFAIGDSNFTLKEFFDGKEKEIKFTLKASNSFSTAGRSLLVTITDEIEENVIVDAYAGPVINEFKAQNYTERRGDVYLVENGKSFELTWNITNALKVELFKNDKSIKTFHPQEKSIELKEQIYDGIEKEIEYHIEASNKSIEIQRRSLTIKIISIAGLVINDFAINNYADINGNTYTVESGKSFTIRWKIQNAQSAELYKNGQLYQRLPGNEGNIEITEHAYDGRQKEINYTLKASANESETKSKSLIVVVLQTATRKPVIAYFKSDKTVLRNGGSYTLSWHVTDADVVELYKNEQRCKTFYGEKSITLAERYEGLEKKIKYTLKATKDNVEIKSNPVFISVKPPINWKLVAAAVIVIFLAVILLYTMLYNPEPQPGNNEKYVVIKDTVENIIPHIDLSRVTDIYQDSTITLQGKNLPLNRDSLVIKFNSVNGYDTSGQIIDLTDTSISVRMPGLNLNDSDVIKLSTYVNGNLDTSRWVTYHKIKKVSVKPRRPKNQAQISRPLNPAGKIEVYDFSFKSLTEGDIVTVYGKNLPVNQENIYVVFGNIKGTPTSLKTNSITVEVPRQMSPVRQVDIKVYVNRQLERSLNGVAFRNKN